MQTGTSAAPVTPVLSQVQALLHNEATEYLVVVILALARRAVWTLFTLSHPGAVVRLDPGREGPGLVVHGGEEHVVDQVVLNLGVGSLTRSLGQPLLNFNILLSLA